MYRVDNDCSMLWLELAYVVANAHYGCTGRRRTEDCTVIVPEHWRMYCTHCPSGLLRDRSCSEGFGGYNEETAVDNDSCSVHVQRKGNNVFTEQWMYMSVTRAATGICTLSFKTGF